MARLVLFALAAAALPLQSLAAGAGPILPGYWESTDTVTSPIRQSKTSRKCITADQIQSYLTGPVNNHYKCHYTDRKMDDHNFSMTGDCVDSSGIPAKVAIEGVYTPTSFTMNGRIRIVIGGLGIPVTASTDARRISAQCPSPDTTPAPDAQSSASPTDAAPGQAASTP